MSAGPPSALSVSFSDKQKYREELCAEVDGLRRQVAELRQHVQQSNMPNDNNHFMAQLQGKQTLNSQQANQLSHHANLMNSVPQTMGQDMRQTGMLAGSSSMSTQSGMNDDFMNERMIQRKQAELNDIIEQQRKLYSNLDSLDRQRSQLLGDIDKSTTYQNRSNDMNFSQGQTGGGGFPSQLSNNLQPHFSPPTLMRSSSNNFPPSPMGFRNCNQDMPSTLMDSNMRGSFGNMSSGGGNFNDSTHIDKRRRLHSFDQVTNKNFQDNRISSSYLPSEIMVTPKDSSNSLSVLNSSRQLLMSQREANMQREQQNMMFLGGMNNGRGIPGFQCNQRMHDGKLPETKRKLPKDFMPEVDTVVLGKGNIPKTNIGNLKLKGIVMDNLVEYANGERRKKIAVISRIINHVTSQNYKTTGFVKHEDDHWWEMTERDARVKITALFRDCLHDQYRSSSSSKVKRRQELRKSKTLAEAANKREKLKKLVGKGLSAPNNLQVMGTKGGESSAGEIDGIKRKVTV